ncbi:phosphatase PAP2 family protein [Pedobacter sp. LMG 31462]|uniref:Phosphatase PAP2 family protein n=2 Tax=Pedobacter gandavensis TaxID=2679963 RepID=A0ABR6ESS6_9SPHI|nr:phosphatase PAP2 family protein [Pedobacter gandavensis]
MNTIVIKNYSRLKPTLFLLPSIFLVLIVVLLYQQDALSVDKYIQIQKNAFIFLNSKLALFPKTMFNLTQLGDEIVLISFLGIFIIYAPKMWECLISASLISCIICTSLKEIFSVPRPAAVFDHDRFVIIGKALTGHNSLPSGHSITVFTVLTVLLFAFMPQRLNYKILWCIFIIGAGLILVFTRVGVGAHYPLDVIIGGLIGYISGLLGVFINEKYPIWTWINNKRYYPIIILFFLFCCISLVNRLLDDHLIIFYLSLITLVISLYRIINVYVKK